MQQNRFKSPVVWGSVLAQALAILVALDLLSPSQSTAVNGVIAAALQLLVTFGILNNPTARDTF